MSWGDTPFMKQPTGRVSTYVAAGIRALDRPFADTMSVRLSGAACGEQPTFLHRLALRVLFDAANEAGKLGAQMRIHRISQERAWRELEAWIYGAPAPLSLADVCAILDLDYDWMQQRLLRLIRGQAGPLPRPGIPDVYRARRKAAALQAVG